MKTVRVFAPATVANIGCGFDAMGFAFEGAGDVISMSFIDENIIKYINTSGVELPDDPELNLMTPALHSIMDVTGGRRGVCVNIEKKIFPGSGIGSSAAAACAAVYAYNILINGGFDNIQLIDFALNGEMMASGARHADNVAPAMLGGVVLIRENTPLDIISIIPPEDLYCAVVHPDIIVKTKDSRAILPVEIPLTKAIRQWANVGALVSGLFMSDYELIGRSLKDVVAEPYRKKFIPEYDLLKSTMISNGALGGNISGSGPSVFALCRGEKASLAVKKVMKNHFDVLGVNANVYSSRISNLGCREIE